MHAIEQSVNETEMYIGTLSVEHEKHMGMMESAETEHEEDNWTEKLRINQRIVTFKLDMGTDCNAMSVQTLKTLDV